MTRRLFTSLHVMLAAAFAACLLPLALAAPAAKPAPSAPAPAAKAMPVNAQDVLIMTPTGILTMRGTVARDPDSATWVVTIHAPGQPSDGKRVRVPISAAIIADLGAIAVKAPAVEAAEPPK